MRRAVEAGVLPFRAVVADSFYGEDEDFKRSLEELGAGYVLALKPSHAWWHKIGEVSSPGEEAVVASEAWEDTQHPGDWLRSGVPLETDTRKSGGRWKWM